MDHLYARLDGLYPQKWRANFAGPEQIENWQVAWAEAFEEEGITPIDIKAGLKACRTRYDWPPSCAEFIKACKPSIDPTVAYYEAIAGVQARKAGEHGKWSHPAVYWAAMPLSFDLGSLTYSQMKGRWEKALFDEMEKSEWEAIPAQMVALPALGKGDLSREKAKEMLAQIGASSMLSQTGRDEKRWAKKILRRDVDGDRSLSALQIRFAKEALQGNAA